MNLAREPLDFRRRGFSPRLSLLMSAFALPIPPGRVTPTPSTAYGTLRYHGHFRQDVSIRGFGTWLQTRYIFGAGSLLDQ